MKIKTSELTGAALDWAVAKCEGVPTAEFLALLKLPAADDFWKYRFSTNWSQGGPIIEREGITTVFCSGDLGEPRNYWTATAEQQGWHWGYGPYHERDEDCSLQIYKPGVSVGPTPLIAAMRCYCASKLGDEVDVPEELL